MVYCGRPGQYRQWLVKWLFRFLNGFSLLTNRPTFEDPILQSLQTYMEHCPHALIVEVRGNYQGLYITRQMRDRTQLTIMCDGRLVAEQG